MPGEITFEQYYVGIRKRKAESAFCQLGYFFVLCSAIMGLKNKLGKW